MTIDEADEMTVDELTAWLIDDIRSKRFEQPALHRDVQAKAGAGELTEAFVDRWIAANERFAEIAIDDLKKLQVELAKRAAGNPTH